MNTKTITTHSPEETIELASSITSGLTSGDLIALVGDLGSGKTVFVKGLAKGMGIEKYLYVNSPSFVILKEYHGRKDLYHFDVYRLTDEAFSDTLDYKRYFYGGGITVIEWADKVRDILPEEYLEVNIEYGPSSERKFNFRSVGPRYEGIVERLS
ncbi:MAG: tRNA (adenosine(37)-N6)-threonylcarbamoyltransferase complex ATPase subunit type 1 TsaE [Candidatus Omnitrophica bacterium]|nr:tRNA (adenosine(37)-N6)-threonylcarbamoyltransferase complex ATPase subunit type 1 TsaE [Candidatus Omnitrophota bacterium]